MASKLSPPPNRADVCEKGCGIKSESMRHPKRERAPRAMDVSSRRPLEKQRRRVSIELGSRSTAESRTHQS